MRRLFVAAIIGLLWTAVFALSLFAQSGPGDLPLSPTSTIPPFEPPTGATITVTTGQDNLADNGDCTLREAIQAANTDTAVDACPAGNSTDLILLPPGGYGLSLEGRSEDENATGDLDIRSSLVISGAGSAGTVIDANQTDRVLHILTGTVEIRGVTVQNGRAADGAGSGCGVDGDYGCPGEAGGGIANLDSLRFIDVVVQNSRSGDSSAHMNPWDDSIEKAGGGGIVNEGRLVLYSTQIIGNRSGNGQAYGAYGDDGGGVYNLGVLIGANVIISANQTGRGGFVPKGLPVSGRGGGVANRGTMTMANGQILTNITGNGGGGGGGVYNTGKLWLSVSDVSDNESGAYRGGGGILNEDSLWLTESTISSNKTTDASDGGGLRNVGTASLFNCTISGNRSGKGYMWYWPVPGGDGGGISNEGDLLIQNTTIVYNRAGEGDCHDGNCNSVGGSGGGIANNGGAVTIHNSLIAQNSVADGGSGPDCTGIVSSQGPNLIGDPAGCTLGGAGDDILNYSAFLGPLTDNGGPTPTHALLPYSPALDAGSCTDISGAPVLTDQRGEPRPQGVGCDLGAFESPLSTIPLPVIRYLPVIQNKPN